MRGMLATLGAGTGRFTGGASPSLDSSSRATHVWPMRWHRSRVFELKGTHVFLSFLHLSQDRLTALMAALLPSWVHTMPL